MSGASTRRRLHDLSSHPEPCWAGRCRRRHGFRHSDIHRRTPLSADAFDRSQGRRGGGYRRGDSRRLPAPVRRAAGPDGRSSAGCTAGPGAPLVVVAGGISAGRFVHRTETNGLGWWSGAVSIRRSDRPAPLSGPGLRLCARKPPTVRSRSPSPPMIRPGCWPCSWSELGDPVVVGLRRLLLRRHDRPGLRRAVPAAGRAADRRLRRPPRPSAGDRLARHPAPHPASWPRRPGGPRTASPWPANWP